MMKKLVFVWMAAVAMLMSCHEKDGNQDTEIIVSKDKVASVKRWLDS
jgi:uncharacterized lipoprotein NlpE involved in copper resistance